MTVSSHQRPRQTSVVGETDFDHRRAMAKFSTEPLFEVWGLVSLLRHPARSRWNAEFCHFPHHLIVEVEVGLRLLYVLDFTKDHLCIQFVTSLDWDRYWMIKTRMTYLNANTVVRTNAIEHTVEDLVERLKFIFTSRFLTSRFLTSRFIFSKPIFTSRFFIKPINFTSRFFIKLITID